MSEIKILALDQASHCGWCCGDNDYGVWDFTTRKDESQGMKGLRFRAKLKEVIELAGINTIIYERVAGQHANSIIHAAKMVSVIETTCEELGVNYASVSASEVKKFATGKGNAGKPAMIKAAQERFGYEGNDDNVADAIHIYQLAKTIYK